MIRLNKKFNNLLIKKPAIKATEIIDYKQSKLFQFIRL